MEVFTAGCWRVLEWFQHDGKWKKEVISITDVEEKDQQKQRGAEREEL